MNIFVKNNFNPQIYFPENIFHIPSYRKIEQKTSDQIQAFLSVGKTF